MPLLQITATETQARLHDAQTPMISALRRALSADSGPVTVMVHGYKYQPGHPAHCPHGSVMSPFAREAEQQGRKTVSWPGHLGLNGQPGEGLGLSFGWDARGSIWAAHRRAGTAGQILADMLQDIRRMAPTRTINVIAHSLGARVVLAAIRRGTPGLVSRAILLAAAEYGDVALDALNSAPGQHTQILNVTSRENDFYDFLMESLVPPAKWGDRMLGFGVVRHPRLVTLQLDDKRSLHTLRQAGFAIGEPKRLICHWSPYMRSGVFPLYRAVLDGNMPLDQLRRLLPVDSTPRWSRLRPRLPRHEPALVPAE